MSVSFNESPGYEYAARSRKGLAARMVRYSGGLLPNERSANLALLGVAMLGLVIAALLLFTGRSVASPEALENPDYGLPAPD